MSHYWFVSGTNGHYVGHSSQGPNRGEDGTGVGVGEDHMGPFSSVKLARKVADALNNAYELGFQSGDAFRRRHIEIIDPANPHKSHGDR